MAKNTPVIHCMYSDILPILKPEAARFSIIFLSINTYSLE